MKNVFFLLLIIAVQSGVSADAQSKRYPAEVEEKIRLVENNLAGWVQSGINDTWNLAERMNKYNINGLSIAVINNHRVEWAKGYGFADVSEKRPVTEKTLFQAASISKSLNSIGILKLVRDNKIDLNSDINRYLISWKFPYDSISKNKVITLTHLLSHTGGLTVSGFPGYETGKPLPVLPQILDGRPPANTGPVRSFMEPGLKFIYSGGGITISQLIVMDVTNQPYDIFMKENVLYPLGMTNSSFTQPPASSAKKLLATGYRVSGKEIPGKYHIYPEQAAAGLWTNPTDLCKVIIDTQLSFEGESSKVLTQELTRLRLTTVAEDAGLGIFVNSRVTGSYKYFNHNGGNEGFCCTSIGCLNEGKGVVIMTNTDYNNNAILEEIANSVATVYKWKDYYIPEKAEVVDVPSSILDKYAGKYDMQGTTITFKRSGNGLTVNSSGDVYWQVYFTSDTDFFIRESKGFLRFVIDPNGKVTGFITNGMTMKRID